MNNSTGFIFGASKQQHSSASPKSKNTNKQKHIIAVLLLFVHTLVDVAVYQLYRAVWKLIVLLFGLLGLVIWSYQLLVFRMNTSMNE